jgi:hypothetical protein
MKGIEDTAAASSACYYAGMRVVAMSFLTSIVFLFSLQNMYLLLIFLVENVAIIYAVCAGVSIAYWIFYETAKAGRRYLAGNQSNIKFGGKYGAVTAH